MEYISCNMGTCDLPEIYALRLRVCAYILGKSLVPVLQLLHIQAHVHFKSVDIVLQILVFYCQQLWRILNSVMCGDCSIRLFD